MIYMLSSLLEEKKVTSSDSSRIFFFLINVFLPKKILSWSLVFSTLVITC